MKRQKRREYSLEDREKYIAKWEEEGCVPRGRFAKVNELTPSMFNRWLQLAGKIPIPEGGMAGGTPLRLRTVSQQEESGKGKGRPRRTDAYIRKVLADCYGSPHDHGSGHIASVAKRHGCAMSQPSEWKKKRPDLMPGGTSIVPRGATLFDSGNGAPQAPPAGLPGGDLQLELGNTEKAASDLFEQNQADAWSELMTQLDPLPPRSRLRVLTLIEKIQA